MSTFQSFGRRTLLLIALVTLPVLTAESKDKPPKSVQRKSDAPRPQPEQPRPQPEQPRAQPKQPQPQPEQPRRAEQRPRPELPKQIEIPKRVEQPKREDGPKRVEQRRDNDDRSNDNRPRLTLPGRIGGDPRQRDQDEDHRHVEQPGRSNRDQGHHDDDRGGLSIDLGPGFRFRYGDDDSHQHHTPNYRDRYRDDRSDHDYSRRGHSYDDRRWGFYLDLLSPRRETVVIPYIPQETIEPLPQAPAAEPPVPTQEQLVSLPIPELQGLFHFAVDRLVDDLGRFDTGAGWKRHLQTDELKRHVPNPSQVPNAPPPSAPLPPSVPPSGVDSLAQQHLAEALRTFDGVSRRPDYSMINGLWGFRTVHVVLRELLVPPVERSRNQLLQATDLLGRDLDEMSVGGGWKTYLKLGALKSVAQKHTHEIGSDELAELQSALRLFEQVSGNSEYRMISELPGFRYTLFAVRNYSTDVASAGGPRTGA